MSRVDPDEILLLYYSPPPFVFSISDFEGGGGVCVSFSVCLCADCLRPEEMFDVIIHKIFVFESSVCVRCQQIAIEQKLDRGSERIVFEGHAGRDKAADGNRNIFMD